MERLIVRAAVVGSFAAAAVLCCGEGRAQQPPPGPIVPPRKGHRERFRPFNGRDLTGWKGHAKYWSVHDGVIIGKNTAEVPVSTYLLTDRSFSDFRLVFDFMLAESEMHSGI